MKPIEFSEVWHDIGAYLLGNEVYDVTKSIEKSVRHPLITRYGKTFLVFGQNGQDNDKISFQVSIRGISPTIGDFIYSKNEMKFREKGTDQEVEFNVQLFDYLFDRYVKDTELAKFY